MKAVDTNLADAEWAEWVSDFRAESPVKAPDLEALQRRARRETVKQWLKALAEIAASIVLAVHSVELLTDGPAPHQIAMAAMNLVFVVVWLGYLFYVRRGTWKNAARTVRGELELTTKRALADVRWFTFTNYCIAALGIAVAAWAPFVVSARWATYEAEPWRAIVGFGGVYAILAPLAFYSAWRRRRARAELGRLTAMEESLGA